MKTFKPLGEIRGAFLLSCYTFFSCLYGCFIYLPDVSEFLPLEYPVFQHFAYSLVRHAEDFGGLFCGDVFHGYKIS